jgi:hypothetical protein
MRRPAKYDAPSAGVPVVRILISGRPLPAPPSLPGRLPFVRPSAGSVALGPPGGPAAVDFADMGTFVDRIQAAFFGGTY